MRIQESLKEKNPKLAEQWHPTKNAPLTPRDVSTGSHKKVWWICEKGHEWEATIASRNAGCGCPYCSGHRVCKDNCLETINPDLARDWHSTKNGSLTPRDVTPGSNKKVWWKCKKGHEWESTVVNRNQGRGCPHCKPKTSLTELRLLTELRHFFGEVKNRKKVHGFEVDIYIPSIKLGIEVDGRYWHRNKIMQDHRKTASLQKNGIILVRLREEGLKRVSKHDVFFSVNQSGFEITDNILSAILGNVELTNELRKRMCEYSKKRVLVNNKEYLCLMAALPSPLPEQNLSFNNLELAQEWHPSKNEPLTPEDVTPNSHMKVWWRCKKGHEWKSTIGSRHAGCGCPYCSGLLANKENCLETVNPKLAGEWHTSKNGSLTPRDVTPGSNKKVWWKCKKGHEWESSIVNRIKPQGCPFCSGLRATKETCLETVNPELVNEWHPTKNEPLTPSDVTPSSHRKVWWRCKKGHEWEAKLTDRNAGNGCPYCSGRQACRENCLETGNPKLAREWHPTKNGSLTPSDVTPGSNKKVWWMCKKGHEWVAMVNDRNAGNGCPYCSGRRATKETCLETVNPELVKEWHPTKNGSLTPRDVAHCSNKKVWWICKKGHEWKTRVADRSKGKGCPYCSGRLVCKDNCLETVNLTLAKEWHPTKNNPLTVSKVTPGSNKKVWWICKKGHEWEAMINNRNKGRGCPYCSGKRKKNSQ